MPERENVLCGVDQVQSRRLRSAFSTMDGAFRTFIGKHGWIRPDMLPSMLFVMPGSPPSPSGITIRLAITPRARQNTMGAQSSRAALSAPRG